jgi:hypothetical protein
VATVGGTSASASTTAGAASAAGAATTAGLAHTVATVNHVTAFGALTAPAQDGPVTTIRIGPGMQLLPVSAPSHATTVARPSPAPQHTTAAATPALAAVAPAPATVAPPPAAHPVASTSPAPPAAPAPPPAPPQPYQLYDSVTPSSIPASSQAVAVYANGGYAAAPGQVGHRGLTLWIDTNGSDPHADVLDVEPGDATPSQAATWVQQKLSASPNSTAIVYTMRSDWGAVQQAVGQLPWWMPSHTKYWIADPTGVPHIVPGSQATQWYWGQNYDISTALPSFN